MTIYSMKEVFNMKKSFLLPLLAVPAFCLTACGENSVYGQTIKFSGNFNYMDEVYQGLEKSPRTLIKENMENINWNECSPEITNKTSADAVIKEILDGGTQYCSTNFGSFSLTFGKEGSNAATANWKGYEEKLTYKPDGSEFQNIYDFKDEKGNAAYEVKIIQITNSKVLRSEVSYVAGGILTKKMGCKYTLPLIKSISVDESHALYEIEIEFYANFTN